MSHSAVYLTRKEFGTHTRRGTQTHRHAGMQARKHARRHAGKPARKHADMQARDMRARGHASMLKRVQRTRTCVLGNISPRGSMHAVECRVPLQYAVYEHGKILDASRPLLSSVKLAGRGSTANAGARWPCISRDVQEAGACPCWVLKSRRSRTMGKTAPTNPIWPDGVTRQNEIRTSPLRSPMSSPSAQAGTLTQFSVHTLGTIGLMTIIAAPDGN